MKPETAAFLAKARKHLSRSQVMLSVNLHEDAGRAAYLVCFHAAQALIFERLDKTFKTHSSVQSEFFRLIRDDARLPAELRALLSQSYNLKAIADYEYGDDSGQFAERVIAAVETAGRFVECLAGLSGETS